MMKSSEILDQVCTMKSRLHLGKLTQSSIVRGLRNTKISWISSLRSTTVLSKVTILEDDNPELVNGFSIQYSRRRQDDSYLGRGRQFGNTIQEMIKSVGIAYASVKSLYDKHKSKQSQPALEEISSALQSVAELYSRVFIVIDVLDEFRASDSSRVRFLAEVFELQAKSAINIFATSRFIPNITGLFEDSASLEIRARDEDVRRYLHNHMSRLPGFVRRSSELQEEVTSGIVHSVGEMYLLAKLHLESLIDKTSAKAVRSALAKLPSGSEASRY
ncbi:hypothetical protein EDB81DRAFT_767892 [Dactylonectria macrodidyma]|uniref:Nephrocystin 3-like N-terminal domain-containing protein n=1 Tax=Dactylonectria macrodidyma TaxID=307937 RepID=A0A9P9IBW3_9HYPO|nr:hypothetical protein EDB81DRAFT_767892 [Dactylonectria macrodidyma]